MAIVTERLRILIESIAHGAVPDLKAVGAASGEVAAKQTLMQRTSGLAGGALRGLGLEGLNTGTALKAGIGIAGVGAVALIGKTALEGVEKFASLTGEVRGFQRVTGASAEDSSRLAAAVRLTGTEAGAAQTGFFQLSRRIAAGKDTLDEYGVSVARNQDGTLNFAKTLENAAVGFQNIGDAGERDKFVMENFGKGGAALIPILSKSRAELEEFFKSAEKHHEIFTQDDLDKGREYSVSLRELKAAFEGIALELGQAAIPLLTGLTEVAKVGIEALDGLGQSIGGVKLSAVGMGAAVGLLVSGGNPLGALAGAAVGLAGALLSSGDAADQFATNVDTAISKIGQLDARSAARQFDELSKAVLKHAIDVADSANRIGPKFLGMRSAAATYHSILTPLTASFSAFQEIAKKDPAAAQLVIDGLKQRGIHTDIYENALRKIIGTQQRHAAAQTEVNNKYQTAEERVKGYIDALEKEQKIEDEIINRQLGLVGAANNYANAVAAQKTAQDEYNAVLNAYGKEAADASDAGRALNDANLAVGQSALALDQAQRDLNVTFGTATPQALQADIDRLQHIIEQSPEAATAMQPIVDKLITQRDLLLFLDSLHATVHLDTSAATASADALIAKFGTLEAAAQAAGIDLGPSATAPTQPTLPANFADFLNQAAPQPLFPGIIPTYAEGGVTDGSRAQKRLAWLHGQEAIFNADQLNALGRAFQPVMDYSWSGGGSSDNSIHITTTGPGPGESIAAFAINTAKALRAVGLGARR